MRQQNDSGQRPLEIFPRLDRLICRRRSVIQSRPDEVWLSITDETPRSRRKALTVRDVKETLIRDHPLTTSPFQFFFVRGLTANGTVD